MSKRKPRDFRAEILRTLERLPDTGASADRIAGIMHIKRHERAPFLLALSKMERDGVLKTPRRGKYTVGKYNIIKSILYSLSPGFGFARPTGGEADVFVPGAYLGGALPGDTVQLLVEPGDERGPRGKVQQIIKEGPRAYSGVYIVDEMENRMVRPDSFIRFPLRVRHSKSAAAAAGDKVRFTVAFSYSGDLVATILSSYGDAESARVCADAIVDSAGIPSEFSAEVMEEAARRAAEPITAEELATRLDLRDTVVFTIDGSDAKDLDDAVSVEAVDGGYQLGVHIADVSHYVRDHTPLGDAAAGRGTSVYFADRVIPMLPTALSNEACSLNPAQDKLAMSVIMTMDAAGRMKNFTIHKSVIRSAVRGVYSEVNALFDGTADDETVKKYVQVSQQLDIMRELSAKLRELATERGIMELSGSESMFVLDDSGHPIDIRPRVSGESQGMIEQFMIAANIACAVFARQNKLPFVYRVHEQPSPEKLADLELLAVRLGFADKRLTDTAALGILMNEARPTQYARLISERILRSMAKARYSPSPLGHYGLSLKDYCHFTSPIRRFPDLVIHRVLSAFLAGGTKDALTQRYETFVSDSADNSSACEVRAMTAERECEDCYKAEYMSRFIGEEFDGVICSVTPFGLYVELANSVTGMVRTENLPEDELRYDDTASLVDRIGKPLYTVGDSLRIRVDGVSVSAGRIDFSPAEKQA